MRQLTDSEVASFTRRVDSLVVTASSVSEMHRKLHTMRRNGSKNWRLLRSPVWRSGVLIAVILKPDTTI